MKRPAEIITGLLGSILTALYAFGVPLTETQMAALVATVGWVPMLITLIVEIKRRGWADVFSGSLLTVLSSMMLVNGFVIAVLLAR